MFAAAMTTAPDVAFLLDVYGSPLFRILEYELQFLSEIKDIN
jgi:hypothetical protein